MAPCRQITLKNGAVTALILLTIVLNSCGDGGESGGTGTTVSATAVCPPSAGARWSPRECGQTDYLTGVAWSGSLYVAVGSSDVLTSPDGVRWTRRTIGSSSYRLHCIAFGKGLFVAGGERVASDGRGEILTSTNGIDWRVHDSPLRDYAIKIIWTGTEFLAIGDHERAIIKSSDGIQWTMSSQTFPDAYDVVWAGNHYLILTDGFAHQSRDGLRWGSTETEIAGSPRSIAWSGSRFVAAGYTDRIYASDNGITWSYQSLPTASGWDKVIWAENQFIVFGPRGTIHVSPDGTSWTERKINAPGISEAIRGDSLYVGVGELGNIATSTDGTDWVPRTILSSLAAVVATDSGFLAVGGYGNVASSPDGKAWSRVATNIVDHSLSDVVWSGSQFVGVGSFSGFRPAIATSSDGANWTRRQEGNYGAFTSIAWSGDLYVASGGEGIFTSPDGVTWTFRDPYSSGGMFGLNHIVWTGSQFVGVSFGSWIYTSPDGVSWTRRTPDIPVNFFSVACSPDRCVGVGKWDWAISCVSVDTISWNCHSWVGGAFQEVYAIAWTGAEFVAAGLQDRILRSPDGTTWTLDNFSGSFSHLTGIAVSGSQLVAVSAEGAIFSSP